MSMALDTLHLPSGFEGIQATVYPISRELESIEHLLDRDIDAQVSELCRFLSADIHSPNYEQNIQSLDQQTSTRTQDMQDAHAISSCAVHEDQLTEPSVNQTFGASFIPDQNEQPQNPQTQELNENFHFPPYQLNSPVIDYDSHPLPYLQTYSLPTHDQGIYLGNIQGNTEAENVWISDIETSSTVNQSHFTLPGFFTEPTHSQTSSSTLQDQTSNEQADSTYSTPSSSRSEDINFFAFTLHNGKLLTYS
ncbi:hypothetical protein EB796_008477 [Bugula neritina]|uniref:Uncharacterized protein n=1 Tax=Bugula neritina TaxID=10212 RepID=A0A7J7K6N1_BUGNE|nr:hypothetical protein EB796_008477 [Bugula neritina]